jgi:DNA-binding TFAR19-related protein (PDSD5 family)
MDELEELKRRKVDAYKKQFNNQLKFQQQVEMLENAIKQRLTREAVERYSNLKAAHPEKAIQLLTVLARIAEQHGQVSDDMLKEILMQMSPERRETKIRKI